MTLDNTPELTSATDAESTPVKRPRRRATRTVAAPGATSIAETASAEPSVAPSAAVADAATAEPIAPVKKRRASTRKAAAPVAEGTKNLNDAATAQTRTETLDLPEADPVVTKAPRSRRASRASGTATGKITGGASKKAASSAEVESALNAILDVVVAERATSGTPNTADTPTKTAKSRRSRAAKVADVVAPDVAAAEATSAAPTDTKESAATTESTAAPSRARRSGGRKTAAQRAAADLVVTGEATAAQDPTESADPQTAASVPASDDQVPAAPRRNTRRRKADATTSEALGAPAPVTSATAESATPAPVAAEPIVEVQESIQAPDAPPATSRRNRRSTRTVLFAEPQLATQDPAGGAERAADERQPAPEPGLEPVPEPAESTPRRGRRSSRRATAESKPAVDAATPATEDQNLAGQAAQPAQAPQAASLRLATNAVLFQAPDVPVRAKRRRATSPTGSPDEVRAALVPEADAVTHADDSDAATVTATNKTGRTKTGGKGEASGKDGRRGAAIDLSEELSSLAGDPTEDSVEYDEDGNQIVVEADPTALTDNNDDDDQPRRRRRRRGGRGRRSRNGSADQGDGSDDNDAQADAAQDESSELSDADATPQAADSDNDADADTEGSEDGESTGSRRRRRRRRGGRAGDSETEEASTSSARTTRTRSNRSDEVTALKGSTRLEAKRQRRRDGRDAGRRRQIITEAEFLARRESVERSMIVREKNGRTQIAVLEDNVLVEHYVSQQSQASMAGNVYLGRVQNVLPSMEAAFVDVGKGRNAVLYAGEVNWDAAGLVGQPRRIEQALKSGDSVLVQVTKDPIGQKGARLTSQVTLAGRYLVYVPGGGMTGISRKLPEPERARLKKILREIVPESAGVIVRTAAEGASEDELKADIDRLQAQWTAIEKKSKTASAPALLQGEPDMSIRVVRDIFNDDFSSLVVAGPLAWKEISTYVHELAPDLESKITRWSSERDVFAEHRIDEQLAKGLDRKVWLPSGGSLVIDRTEAMTVVDVNTGKFTGSGGTLEETVTRNNLEAAEEIVRQLRLRDIGGIVVIDFIDMVLESNRDLVLRRLVECLGRDRTKHQVAEVTSLGLVQMTRKRVGQGLVEAFSETCEHCHGRGFIVHDEPIEKDPQEAAPQVVVEQAEPAAPKKSRRRKAATKEAVVAVPVLPEASSEARETVKATLAQIAAAAAHAHEQSVEGAEAESGSAHQGTESQNDGDGNAAGEQDGVASERD